MSLFSPPVGRLLALFGVCLALAACEKAEPPPVAHAHLHVQADGQLTLDQQPVALTDLADQLRTRVGSQPNLMVEVHASPQADLTRVQAATAAIRAAHARLAFDAEGATGATTGPAASR